MPYYVYRIPADGSEPTPFEATPFGDHQTASKFEAKMKIGRAGDNDYSVVMFFASRDEEAQAKALDISRDKMKRQ